MLYNYGWILELSRLVIHTSCRSESSYICLVFLDKLGLGPLSQVSDTHLLSKWIKPYLLGHFRQNYILSFKTENDHCPPWLTEWQSQILRSFGSKNISPKKYFAQAQLVCSSDPTHWVAAQFLLVDQPGPGVLV